MNNHDWTRFTVRIPIRSTVQQVYDAWATPAALARWFLREAIFTDAAGNTKDKHSQLEKGDHYTWHWHGYDESPEQGEIIAANGRNHLRFVFGKAGIVDVHIGMEDNETMMELVQESIATDERSMVNYYVGCSNGWTFYAANLKSLLEGGIDLRNKNVRLKKVLNS